MRKHDALCHTNTHQDHGLSSLNADNPASKAWTDYKRIAGVISAAFGCTDHDRLKRWSERIKDCAHSIAFAYTPHPEGHKRELLSARLCRVRTCPICQWRRSLRITAEVGEAMKQMCGPDTGHVAVMLTLTVKNVDVSKLRESIKGMLKAWSKLTRRVVFSGVKAWARSVEVTRGRDYVLWDTHPHIHALFVVPAEWMTTKNMDSKAWAAEWKDLLGLDYDPRCDIRAITGDAGAGVREVLKYAVKPSAESAAAGWLGRVALAIDGLRMLGTSQGLRVSDELPEDARHDDTEAKSIVAELPYMSWRPAKKQHCIMIYRWGKAQRQYLRSEIVWGITPQQWRDQRRIEQQGMYASEHNKPPDKSVGYDYWQGVTGI